jgi:hypothetical protein
VSPENKKWGGADGQTPLIAPPPTIDLHLEKMDLDEGRGRLWVC